MNNKWYFYIACCKDNSLYIGISSNPGRRIVRHNRGQGSAWIKQHGIAQIVYLEEFNSYLSARKREAQVKRWSRIKKEQLILRMS